MVQVTFIGTDGSRQHGDGAAGTSLLALAQALGQPLEGTCEGQMACSTCHVVVAAEWFDRLPPPVDAEEDLLDLASGARRTSRLGCQILLTPELDGLVVELPTESRNVQGI